jgi:hypothetical protein
MEINNKEKIKNVDFDEIISKFHKIKDTVTNLKQVNNIIYIYLFILINRQMIYFFFLSITNQVSTYIIHIKEIFYLKTTSYLIKLILN